MHTELNEELLQQKFVASDPRQAELVKHYCETIDRQIQAADSGTEARRIVSAACRQFDDDCESSVMKNFLRKHVNQLLEQFWTTSP